MTVKTIDAPTLKSWLAAGEAVVVDVREPGEVASGHVPGAHTVPLGSLDRFNPADFGGKRVVFVCASGARSGRACASLASLPVEAFSLQGGMSAWRASGGPVEGAIRAVLPLDRQVQLTAGSIAFAGFLLGVFVHPGFHGISGFVGAGLMFAGASGFCGMARVLALAPWNRAPA